MAYTEWDGYVETFIEPAEVHRGKNFTHEEIDEMYKATPNANAPYDSSSKVIFESASDRLRELDEHNERVLAEHDR